MAKVKVNFKSLQKLPDDIRKEVINSKAPEVIDAIVEQITGGLSPVSGFNRYKKYTDSYARKKGVSPNFVTLVDTGEMLENLQAKPEGNKLLISFPDKEQNKKAEGNNKTRRMLPVGNEKFKQKILDKINSLFNKAAESAVKKQ